MRAGGSTANVLGGAIEFLEVDYGSQINVLAGSVTQLFSVGGNTGVSGGAVGPIFGSVNSMVEVSGGTVSGLYLDTGKFHITGGVIGTAASFYSSGSTISGGVFTGAYKPPEDCFSTGGGSAGGVISALYGSGGIHLSGGLFEPGATFCIGSDVLNVFGQDLVLTGTGDRIASLTGTLLDGNEISVNIGALATEGHVLGGRVVLFNVPEPTTGLLVIAGLIGFGGRRRRTR